MHVHIHALRINEQVQHRRRMPVAAEKIIIGRAQGPIKRAVQHWPAVHKDKLLHRRAARIGRQGGIARQAQPLALHINAQGIGAEIGPQNARKSPMQRVKERALLGIGAKDHARRLAIGGLGKGKADQRFGHRQPPEDLGDRLRLGPVAAQKFQPRRGGVEQISQLDHRAARDRRRAHRPLAPAHHRDCMSVQPLHPAGQHQPPNSAKAGQRFAPKAERADVQQVRAINFRRRMPRHRQGQICRRHSAAVIRDPDQHLAARRIIHRYPPRARVQGVLDQLLDRRGWPLHHLARRNAVDRRLIQRFDHRAPFGPRYLGFMQRHAPNPSRSAQIRPIGIGGKHPGQPLHLDKNFPGGRRGSRRLAQWGWS